MIDDGRERVEEEGRRMEGRQLSTTEDKLLWRKKGERKGLVTQDKVSEAGVRAPRSEERKTRSASLQ
jgi:hypothetical protein